MKKTILCALVALIAGIVPAVAQELKVLSSSHNGFSCKVPDNATFMQNDDSAVIITTPDQEFLVSAVPFNVSESSDEDNAQALKLLADNAQVDLDAALAIELENENMTGGVFIQTKDNGSASCVGIMQVTGTELAYYIAVVVSPNYADVCDAVLKSLDFDPDAVIE